MTAGRTACGGALSSGNIRRLRVNARNQGTDVDCSADNGTAGQGDPKYPPGSVQWWWSFDTTHVRQQLQLASPRQLCSGRGLTAGCAAGSIYPLCGQRPRPSGPHSFNESLSANLLKLYSLEGPRARCRTCTLCSASLHLHVTTKSWHAHYATHLCIHARSQQSDRF